MKHLVTSALPYANGPLHFGHLVGAYLPADIYVRHLRIKGEKVKFICGSDEHGVAIMMGAQKEKKSYQEYVDGWNQKQVEFFDKFNVAFDFFGRTSADYHAEETVKWFKALYDKGFIGDKDNQQLQCKTCSNHLPDRFVEGTCYECGYEHARGDECPNCGIFVEPTRLINPVCKFCGSRDIHEVTVTQYYLLISKFEKELKEWLGTKKDVWRKSVYTFVEALTKEGFVDRAITRDLDWGIDLPLPNSEGKKLYVWFDAPIGYVSNLKKHLEDIGSDEDYMNDWWLGEDTEITNFLAKDNVIFHCIIFPMMSMASGRAKGVYDVPANQYLNLAGKQFSKSSGWYVDAIEAVNKFGPDALRYYLISILPDSSDSNFTWNGFQAKVNGELANNIGNLVNRCMKFWRKNWSEGISKECFSEFSTSETAKSLSEDLKKMHTLIENKEFKKALEQLMQMGQRVNTFFSDKEPWAVFKTNPDEAAKIIAETGLQILILGAAFRPFLPDLADKILTLFNDDVTEEVLNRLYMGDMSVIDEVFNKDYALASEPQALVPKIDDKIIEALNEELNSKTN